MYRYCRYYRSILVVAVRQYGKKVVQLTLGTVTLQLN
eukprot:SAG22_NODE_3315_length_1784_cov_0.930564_1_plen_36_part_10